MKPQPIVALGLVFGLVAAGCLGPKPADDLGNEAEQLVFDPLWYENALPSDPERHDHFNATQHQGLSTPNFELQGWNPLISEHAGMTVGGHLCGDSHDNGEKRYAAVHGLGTSVAFMLVDVTDATDPQVVGELYTPNARTRDLALTPDLKYVVLGNSQSPTPSNPATLLPDVELPDNQPMWKGACDAEPRPVEVRGSARTEDSTPYTSGAVLVNIEDPANPVVESYMPLPALGAHSMYATKIGEQYYVLASVVNLVAAVTYFLLMEIRETPAGAELVVLSALNESPLESNAPAQNGHNDGVIGIHPVTKQTLAYLAHWHQGLVIVDISNPRAPLVIGRWSDNPPGNTALGTNDYGDVHEALPLPELWNGKHYTFIGQEILGHPTTRPSGYMKAIDTTDPTDLKEAAHWNLPAEVQWNASLQFSTHYISRVNHTIFMSHYHAGLWAIDVSDIENHKMLPAVGVFVPANVSPKPPPRKSYGWTPTIMENNALPNGDLVVWDSSSGVYVVKFDETQPAPAAVWDPS